MKILNLFEEKILRPYVSKLLESTFAEVIVGTSDLIVGAIYKHPNLKINDFLSKFEPFLEKLNKEKKTLVLLGDFNIDLLEFESKPEIFNFLDILSSYLIKPHITLPTRIAEKSRTLIDNIFISAIPNYTTSGNFITGISDHLIQFCIFNNPQFDNLSDKTKGHYRDWKNFNQKNFSDTFNNLNWEEILEIEKNDPNICFDNFYEKLKKLINDHVPIKKITKQQRKKKLKPWVTNCILISMSIRDKLLKKSINAKDAINEANLRQKYNFYRNSIVNLLRVSKKLYFKRYFNLNSNNPKKTWEAINEIIYKRKQDQPNIVLNSSTKKDEKNSDPVEVSNEFNKFFTTIASKIQAEIPQNGNFEDYIKKPTLGNSFFFTPVTRDEVLSIFKSLNHNKSSGDFSIPSKIFDSVPEALAHILEKILNLTFQTGIFPNALKTVKVIPVFKNKGSNQDVDNYRPISLLSNIDKIFEKLVYSRLISYLDHHQIISDRQFGFRKNHSTNLALISLTEEIRRSLDASKFSCGVFIDLKKAFDTVDHKISIQTSKTYFSGFVQTKFH